MDFNKLSVKLLFFNDTPSETDSGSLGAQVKRNLQKVGAAFQPRLLNCNTVYLGWKASPTWFSLLVNPARSPHHATRNP